MGIPQKEYRKFLVTGEQIARLRGQLNSHKESKVFPLRRIVSQIDDPTYLLNKELT